MDESGLDLRFTHAFDIRINFDKRWLIGPVSGGANVGYTRLANGDTAQPAKTTLFAGENAADVRKSAAGDFFQ